MATNWAWVFVANLKGPKGDPGDPLSAGAIAAAEAAAQAKVDAINPVRRADELAPVAGALADEFKEVVPDSSGRLSEATFNDGTKYLPHLRSDLMSIGVESSTAAVSPLGFINVDADASDRISSGTRDDGTIYAPVFECDVFTFGGVTTRKVVYVVTVAGQSNAKWEWFDATTVRVREAHPQVFVWNAGSYTAVPVSLNYPESLGLNFCLEFADRNPNAVVIAVPTAVGSSGFTAGVNGTWDPDSVATPNLYNKAVADTKAAVAATGGTLLAMLWSQGENDRSTMTEAQYATKFDYMAGKFRTDVGVSDLPIIVGSMTPEEIAAAAPGTAGIAAAHVDTPRRVTRTAYVYGPKDYGRYGEQIHYSFAGNAIRGKIMATDGLYRARLNVTGKNPISPNSIKISRSGTTAEITWAAPPCRFTAFNLETSTDSGVTWVPQTLSGPVAISHSMTGLTASNPLWARLSTTNETGTSAKTIEVKA